MRRIRKMAPLAAVTALSALMVGGFAGSASAATASISCTHAQQAGTRTINFNCHTTATARYFIAIECTNAAYVDDYYDVWSGSLTAGNWTYSASCPIFFDPTSPTWGLGYGP